MPLQPPEPRFYWAHVREGYRITVPAAVRRHLGLEPGGEIEFVESEGLVKLRKAGAQQPGSVGSGR